MYFLFLLLDAGFAAITTAADVAYNKGLKCWTRAVRDRGRSRRAHGSGSFERPRARSRHRDRLSGKNQGQTAMPASKDHQLIYQSLDCLATHPPDGPGEKPTEDPGQ